MGRLLQVLGVVFVLALVGGSFAGFVVLKDRVKVVVAADEVAAGPDPVALLRDDVATLTRDLGALQAAVASNFEKLAQGLDAADEQRQASVLGKLALLQQRVDSQVLAQAPAQQELATRLQALAQGLAGVQAALAARPDQPRAPAIDVVPVAVPTPNPNSNPTANGNPAAVTTAPTVPAVPLPEATPAQVESQKPRKAFGFDVPTAKFRFDEPQDFVLLPELSRVGFDAKSTLHDFTGVTSKLRGQFRAALGNAQGAWTGTVEVDAATLLTGVDGRDANLREHLATKEHPTITFALERFEPAADGIDAAKRTVRGTVHGTMTIRGQGKPISMPVTVEVDPQQRVVLEGQMPLKLSDYGVPVPSQLGVINMQDEVSVWIALRARVKAGGGK